jgi:hypothetical protein
MRAVKTGSQFPNVQKRGSGAMAAAAAARPLAGL